MLIVTFTLSLSGRLLCSLELHRPSVAEASGAFLGHNQKDTGQTCARSNARL